MYICRSAAKESKVIYHRNGGHQRRGTLSQSALARPA
jgi:hypothetical protein